MVYASQNTIGQHEESAATGAGIATMAHEITSAIADSRTTPTSKIRQYQFSSSAFMYRLVGIGVKYFSDEFAFIDVQPLLLCTSEAESAHLCHTSVVKGSCIPGILNTFSCSGNRCARLTSMDSYTHIG